MYSKIAIFISNLFSSRILENEIVTTILYNFTIIAEKAKQKLDITVNNDI